MVTSQAALQAFADEGVPETPPRPTKTLTVLVVPVENLSQARSMITYKVATNPDPNAPKRSFRVDRYSEAPRAILEDILGASPRIRIVERQRVDAILLESEFGRLSGLVDPEKAMSMGRLIGADAIVMGTILDVRSSLKGFSGYGIKTMNTVVQCSVRVRVIDVQTGSVPFTRVVRGSSTLASSPFGGVEDSDVAYAIIESALEQLRDNDEFITAFTERIRGRQQPPPAAAPSSSTTPDEMVEVEFAPIPENCDIEIDGVYVGGSPLKRALPLGKEVKVRIAKAGYVLWEGRILPAAGLRITRELEPVKHAATTTAGESQPAKPVDPPIGGLP